MNQELLIMIIALVCAGGTVIAILLYLIHSKRRDLQDTFDRAALDGIKYPAYTLKQLREPGYYWALTGPADPPVIVQALVDFDSYGELRLLSLGSSSRVDLRSASFHGPIPIPRTSQLRPLHRPRWPRAVPAFIHRYPAKA